VLPTELMNNNYTSVTKQADQPVEFSLDLPYACTTNDLRIKRFS